MRWSSKTGLCHCTTTWEVWSRQDHLRGLVQARPPDRFGPGKTTWQVWSRQDHLRSLVQARPPERFGPGKTISEVLVQARPPEKFWFGLNSSPIVQFTNGLRLSWSNIFYDWFNAFSNTRKYNLTLSSVVEKVASTRMQSVTVQVYLLFSRVVG